MQRNSFSSFVRLVYENTTMKLVSYAEWPAGYTWPAVPSRAYYAFHAITALRLSHGETYSSHAQVIGMFNKRFVQSGVFPKEFTTILTRLFDDRQSDDYDVTIGITKVRQSKTLGTRSW